MSEGLNVAVLTVSDTRTHETDTSGQFLEESLLASGHQLADRAIVIDDIYQIVRGFRLGLPIRRFTQCW